MDFEILRVSLTQALLVNIMVSPTHVLVKMIISMIGIVARVSSFVTVTNEIRAAPLRGAGGVFGDGPGSLSPNMAATVKKVSDVSSPVADFPASKWGILTNMIFQEPSCVKIDGKFCVETLSPVK